MNAAGSKYLLWLLRVWHDEACASPVEGAILACGMAAAAMFAAVGLGSEMRQIADFLVSLFS